MDKLTEYPKLIKRILSEYIELCNRREHFMDMTVYVHIRGNKFWIEEDWTEEGIATDLVRAGVATEDIVLTFHEPKMRHYTDFAVAS